MKETPLFTCLTGDVCGILLPASWLPWNVLISLLSFEWLKRWVLLFIFCLSNLINETVDFSIKSRHVFYYFRLNNFLAFLSSFGIGVVSFCASFLLLMVKDFVFSDSFSLACPFSALSYLVVNSSFSDESSTSFRSTQPTSGSGNNSLGKVGKSDIGLVKFYCKALFSAISRVLT